MRRYSKFQKGFTMVELSIVLVIIGLIVAGVLVGQDLIRGAEVRATVSQLERFSTTVNTFRVKYTQMPGDINKAEDFGLADLTTTQGMNGDANGLISVFDGSAPSPQDTIDNPIDQAVGEIVNFWYHLSRAKLIEGSFDGGVNPDSTPKLSETFPRTKMNRGGFTVYNRDGINHFHIGVTNSTSGANHSFANNLRPEEAYGIDVKIDDGFPERGATIALSGDFDEWGAAPACIPGVDGNRCALTSTDSGANDGCMFDPGGNKELEYDLFSTGLLCQLRVRMN